MEPQKKNDQYSFSDETIKSLMAFGEVLRGIHNRLIKEGYLIKDGVIELPDSK